MAQTHAGAFKIVATNLGMSLEDFEAKIAGGEKHCSICRRWHYVSEFGKDASRHDGLAPYCKASRSTRSRARYVRRPRPKSGRRFVVIRDGDKKQARGRVNHLVRYGLLPEPNTVPCVDCGHRWENGERRHEYDHHKGYDAEHHEHVEAVCTKCHVKREIGRGIVYCYGANRRKHDG